jgi:hypothetical protein
MSHTIYLAHVNADHSIDFPEVWADSKPSTAFQLIYQFGDAFAFLVISAIGSPRVAAEACS